MECTFVAFLGKLWWRIHKRAPNKIIAYCKLIQTNFTERCVKYEEEELRQNCPEKTNEKP
jgi:hypothetical protein